MLCDLDPRVKVIGKKAGICDGVPSTAALVFLFGQSKLELGTNWSTFIRQSAPEILGRLLV